MTGDRLDDLQLALLTTWQMDGHVPRFCTLPPLIVLRTRHP